MYRAITRHICVQVRPEYLESQSYPDDHAYVWAYHISIENQSQETVRLISRYWHITDGYGQVQEVRGPGVVGKQPELKPGQRFKYTSGTQLKSPSGIMVGHYHMLSSSGEPFNIDIPAFSLDIPQPALLVN